VTLRRGCLAHWRTVVALAVVLLLASVVHVTPPRRLRIVDQGGRPLAGAWLAYHFHGHRFAVVESLTWQRPGGMVRADANGEVRLPARVHLRMWPVDTGPDRSFDLVYAPSLHNAEGPLGDGTGGRSGRLAVRPDGFALADLTGDPEEWATSLYRLHGYVRYTLAGGADERRPPGHLAALAALAAALAGEYTAFQRTWGASARTVPPPPEHLRYAADEERRRWRETAAAHVAREPLWGPYMARLWEDSLRELQGHLETPAGDR
jgi:hypothetical protein